MNFRFLGSAVAAIAFLTTSLAQAADIPRPIYKGVRSVVAYYNWTGFYLGINGGYAFGDTEWTGMGTGTFDVKGWLIGATIGYNYQVGSFVFGIEGDYDWTKINGTSNAGLCAGLNCETSNTYLATVRGRIGYAFDRWLPYITGGAAFGNIKATSALGADTTSKTGWTVGAGLEYAFLGNWSAKIEYLYVDLGSAGCVAACGNPAVPVDVDFTANVIRLGINYKFAGPIFSRW